MHLYPSEEEERNTAVCWPEGKKLFSWLTSTLFRFSKHWVYVSQRRRSTKHWGAFFSSSVAKSWGWELALRLFGGTFGTGLELVISLLFFGFLSERACLEAMRVCTEYEPSFADGRRKECESIAHILTFLPIVPCMHPGQILAEAHCLLSALPILLLMKGTRPSNKHRRTVVLG